MTAFHDQLLMDDKNNFYLLFSITCRQNIQLIYWSRLTSSGTYYIMTHTGIRNQDNDNLSFCRVNILKLMKKPRQSYVVYANLMIF